MLAATAAAAGEDRGEEERTMAARWRAKTASVVAAAAYDLAAEAFEAVMLKKAIHAVLTAFT